MVDRLTEIKQDKALWEDREVLRLQTPNTITHWDDSVLAEHNMSISQTPRMHEEVLCG